MRLNEKELKYAGKHLPSDLEGRLSHKQPRDVYKNRLFKLRGNLLYYTRISEVGIPDSEVLGVLILENFTVQVETAADQPFVFSIVFTDEPDRQHLFSCQSQQQCDHWVEALQRRSYHGIKEEFQFLQERLKNLRRKASQASVHRHLKPISSTYATTAVSRTPPVPRRSAPPPPMPARPLSTPDAISKEAVPTGLLIDL